MDSSRIIDNPFFVLGLSCDASRIELEREAQKLLGMLELGFPGAQTYATPLGPRPRTAEMVRAAVATLRDPYQRLLAELWARFAPRVRETPVEIAQPETPPAVVTRQQLGWKP